LPASVAAWSESDAASKLALARGVHQVPGDDQIPDMSAPSPSGIDSATRRDKDVSRRWPRHLALAFAGLLGALVGIGVFTFGYGEGWSYLSHDPAACANCHVMQGHYDSWQNSGHRHVAVCNDCHLPHDPIGKWVTKGENGFFHSLAFTLENFHEPIRIKARNARVTQKACVHCHESFVHAVSVPGDESVGCVHCHSEAGHALR